VFGKEGAPDKIVAIVNFHFKSKRGGEGDPAGLEYETLRMQMAEALRRIVENRHAQSFANGATILVVLGDRNSHFDTASARILEGILTLNEFQRSGKCRLSKRGVPLCQAETRVSQKLFSVLTTDRQASKQPGTFVYKGEFSWLDDILLPAEALPFARSRDAVEGDYDAGVVYKPATASDHAMVYVRLNW
jgi:predicted extracellular nuclease